MKKFKIVVTLVIVAVFALALVGCGSGGSSSDTYKIGILQQLEHPALDKATEGFKAGAEEALGKDKVEFDEQNAQGEQANCATIAGQFVNDKKDLILANATQALQASATATNEIPIVGTSVTDYATALDIDDWSGATGTNVTGTSDLAPLDQQADMIKELCPDANQVGIIYCSAEANSTYQVKEIGKALDKLGMKHKEYSAADSNEVQTVTTKAASECEVIYIPTDNTMASSTETIKNVVVDKKIPVIAGEQGIMAGCGVATLSIDYYDIGFSAGKMAGEILKDGKKPGEMDIQTAEKVTKMYNPEICKSIGFEIPDGYEKYEAEEE